LHPSTVLPFMTIFYKIWSYFFPVVLKKYKSEYSGTLLVMVESGKKVLNTPSVNYSYNSLHRIFKQAFKISHLQLSPGSKALLLGLGGGSIVEILRKHYLSSVEITAVEIDPVIIDIAKNEFNIEKTGPVRIIHQDAFVFMQQVKDAYQLICVDLFIHDKVPLPFLSTHFMSQLVSALAPGGRIYFNFMTNTPELTSRFNASLQELSIASGIHPDHVTCLNLEENNRVLVITK
jgi:spermidine synthase